MHVNKLYNYMEFQWKSILRALSNIAVLALI